MKLRVKIFLLVMAVVVGSSAMISVVLEFVMGANIQNARIMAKRESVGYIKTVSNELKDSRREAMVAEEKKAVYDSVEEYYNERALVKLGDKYGYIDRNGKEVIPVQFEFANNFINGQVKVKKDGKWGYIDVNGKELIPIEYSYCGEVSTYGENSIVGIGNGGKYGFMNLNGTKLCELKYDKVEPFNENGWAKVVLDGLYGYMDTTGKIVEPIKIKYEESNTDFTGEWHGTKIHSSKAGTVIINGQTATSFNFEVLAKYFTERGNIKGTAEIVEPNKAIYKHQKGQLMDEIVFKVIDGELIISAATGGSCGMNTGLTAVGTYTLDVPKYTNENVMENVFDDDEKLYARIKKAIGEELYDAYFLYGFKNGEYTITEFKEKSDIIQGTLYTVRIPTLEKDFKLMISKEHIYFFAKTSETYRTDDINRQSLARMPAALAFDEI